MLRCGDQVGSVSSRVAHETHPSVGPEFNVHNLQGFFLIHVASIILSPFSPFGVLWIKSGDKQAQGGVVFQQRPTRAWDTCIRVMI